MATENIEVMMPRIPTVMVSSTFYDLKQLRQNLSAFIDDELGWRALLSEHSSFPVDPDADTIENCRRRVQQKADIMVLVVGGRYGYVDAASQKSITNLEYLAARAKGIPIYVFVSKGIIPLLPVWEKNPSADFSTSVDNPALFDFVRQIRSVHKTWVFEFEYADDISSTLRQQFAYLVSEWMQLAAKVRRANLSDFSDLSPEGIKIALEEPDGWEYLLFFTALRDQLTARRDLKRQNDLRLSFGPGTYLDDRAVPDWMQSQLADLTRLSDAWSMLVHNEVSQGFGPVGQPGDKAKIIFAAKSLGLVYEGALEWAQRVRAAHVSERFAPPLRELEHFSEGLVATIEDLSADHLEEVKAALNGEHGDHHTIEINLTLSIPNIDEFSKALRQARR